MGDDGREEGRGGFRREGRMGGKQVGDRTGLSEALLHQAVFGGGRVCVVASAMSVLSFVPVIQVFAFTCVSLPLLLPFSLPLPSPLLVLLIFAVVAIPPLPPLILLPSSWELRELHNKD